MEGERSTLPRRFERTQQAERFVDLNPSLSPWNRLAISRNVLHWVLSRTLQVSEVSKDYRRLVSRVFQNGSVREERARGFCSLASVAVMFVVVLYGVLRCESVWVHLGSTMVLGMLWMQNTYVGGSVREERARGLLFISIRGRHVRRVLYGVLRCESVWVHLGSTMVGAGCKYIITGNCLTESALPGGNGLTIPATAWITTPTFNISPFSQSRPGFSIRNVLLLRTEVEFRSTGEFSSVTSVGRFTLLCVSSDWPEQLMFVLVSFAVTSIQHIQFCLNHFSANPVGAPLFPGCLVAN
ncbi:hypothetical protein F3Y22_tig00110570pilonHSYRG00206 [Hibiscus syriacus]|uniref:Uncharacterized protein n=1 Tax=Hibiscus syriacus TaxID=106335 RepID=A0A6A3A5Z8_HIBSY|nr:hypothetical protein F3Y22_tig00110570pilonHSYRG00206 [Hibiscus syriacus]